MQVLDNIRSALRALRANKLRSILTMLGIIIGVSAVISLLSIGQGVENFINGQFNALGTNLLFVMSKLGNSQSAQFAAQFANQTTLTQGDARALGDPRQDAPPAGSDRPPLRGGDAGDVERPRGDRALDKRRLLDGGRGSPTGARQRWRSRLRAAAGARCLSSPSRRLGLWI